MSRSKKSKKSPGYDFWSKRHPSKSLGYGPVAKQITKRRERALTRIIEWKAKNAND